MESPATAANEAPKTGVVEPGRSSITAVEQRSRCKAGYTVLQMGTRTLDRRRLDSPHRNPLLEHFGLAVRRLREQRELTRDAVAAVSGLSSVYIGNIERGEVNPTLLTQFKLARGIGIPLDEIIAAALTDVSSDAAEAPL
ncbi:helix-turn-helix domain-containing protein [Conexibacter sp. CPCC 206217]|uniref:helix-turn-helix domain-containing protein n=1 Tax=Conexibacter sp. CPCC 206217 TaxID=3064574 RepID=UPI00271A2211|nr:helix-turn-helix domain-containing protein [Conexibacter sp. CPCC 206217]MDO8210669.1 helix-turn-helix domain-containing protein [Conexibacter sp. CPCC 206217]